MIVINFSGIGSSYAPLWFYGKIHLSDDNYYTYPQSLVKQMDLILLKDPISYYKFDIILDINYGIFL